MNKSLYSAFVIPAAVVAQLFGGPNFPSFLPGPTFNCTASISSIPIPTGFTCETSNCFGIAASQNLVCTGTAVNHHILYALVAGGGSGGRGVTTTGTCGTAGGGAGGVQFIGEVIVPGTYPIVIGAGGTPAGTGSTAGHGGVGGNSTFNGHTANGGGGGGNNRTTATDTGGSGGSGGGGGCFQGSTGGLGITNQGNAGGNPTLPITDCVAGGGGWDTAGQNASSPPTGAGGFGFDLSLMFITSLPGNGKFALAGGGSGGGNLGCTAGPTTGGGGVGGIGVNGQSGAVNTGGGGGGTWRNHVAGNGGSGVFYIQY